MRMLRPSCSEILRYRRSHRSWVKRLVTALIRLSQTRAPRFVFTGNSELTTSQEVQRLILEVLPITLSRLIPSPSRPIHTVFPQSAASIHHHKVSVVRPETNFRRRNCHGKYDGNSWNRLITVLFSPYLSHVGPCWVRSHRILR